MRPSVSNYDIFHTTERYPENGVISVKTGRGAGAKTPGFRLFQGDLIRRATTKRQSFPAFFQPRLSSRACDIQNLRSRVFALSPHRMRISKRVLSMPSIVISARRSLIRAPRATIVRVLLRHRRLAHERLSVHSVAGAAAAAPGLHGIDLGLRLGLGGNLSSFGGTNQAVLLAALFAAEEADADNGDDYEGGEDDRDDDAFEGELRLLDHAAGVALGVDLADEAVGADG